MLINLVDILHELRLKIDGDKLSENEKQVNIITLFVNKKEFTDQISSLKHLLIKVKKALKTKISKNKKMHANDTELMKTKNHRILKLKRNLICLKQKQRKHKTRKVDDA
jgi:Fe2+ transport system protein B